MKRHLLSFITMILMVMVISCGGTPASQPAEPSAADSQQTTAPVEPSAADSGRRVDSRVPQFVRDAVRKSPENGLVGIGVANMASINQSRTISATRARAEISRQMVSVFMDAVTDFTVGSEVDHSAVIAFQEIITVALSKSQLVGSSVVDEDMDENGNYWTVVMMSSTAVANEINQAVSEARLAVPAMAAFNAIERMEGAFQRLNNSELGYSDTDR